MNTNPTLKIAYADDHTIVRKGIAGLLNNMDNLQVVIEAGNGQELIDRIAALPEPPDVCMLDINMPVMDGFETIVALKKQWPHIGILVLTVFDIEYYFIRMVLSGANGYLLKSCSPDEIRKALLAIHNNGIYYSDVVARNYFHALRNNEMNLPKFTDMEVDIMKQCCSDKSFTEIARDLSISIRTFERHRDVLFEKLRVTSRVGLAMFAVQFGLVPKEINSSANKYQ
jgi:DNA-binding NarL/FixJ family response regulator